MKKRFRRSAEGAEVNMTPMLDIVFILLIFFIVTSTILQEEGLQMIAPPTTEEEPENERQAKSILIQIDQDNAIFVNGRLTDPAGVTAAVQRQNVDNGGQSAVVIQPDPDSQHGVVTRVYDASQAADVVGGVVVRAPERTTE